MLLAEDAPISLLIIAVLTVYGYSRDTKLILKIPQPVRQREKLHIQREQKLQ